MPMKLLSVDEFRDGARDGDTPDGTVYRFATAEPQDVAGASRTKRFVFSDATVDHAGDSIDPKGWDLGVFNANPVALWAHDSYSPPIGRAANVGVTAGKLVGDIEFAPPEVSEFADSIYRLVEGGFLKAVSVGFKPKEWTFTNDKDRPYGIDFKKQTLLEISVCSVPCNPAALSEARSLGIDTTPLMKWAEKVLDSGETVFLPRKELEALRGQAAGRAEPRYYVSVPNDLSVDQALAMAEQVKGWQEDPSKVMVLSGGATLRAIADVVADPSVTTVIPLDDHDDIDLDGLIDGIKSGTIDAATARSQIEKVIAEQKAGHRISAATKAKMQEAIDHHEAATKCIKDIMDGDGDMPGDDPDGDDPQTRTVDAIVVDENADLTPEQRRIKEARALKASLPTND